MTEQETPDFKANLGKLPLAEKILGIVAILVLIGWGAMGKAFWKSLFDDWFATLSSLGALAIATLVILKLFGKRPLHARIDRHVIAVASLLPVVGLILSKLKSFPEFLCMGGSIALAYISAVTYWRKHIPLPELATEAPGEAAAAPTSEEPGKEPASEPAKKEEPAEDPGKSDDAS